MWLTTSSQYHYDANGNTLSVSVGTSAGNGQDFTATLTGGGAVAYTYDAFNRMTSVQNGEGIHTYAYRPDGLRQSKTVGGVTTTHIWTDYLRVRCHDPMIGRSLSEDTHWNRALYGDDPLSLNKYSMLQILMRLGKQEIRLYIP